MKIAENEIVKKLVKIASFIKKQIDKIVILKSWKPFHYH